MSKKIFVTLSSTLLLGLIFFLASCNNQEEGSDMGINIAEIDLSERGGNIDYWYERGGEIFPNNDLSQVLGQPITTDDEAIEVATEILRLEISEISFDGMSLELTSIVHDPNQNIWIFGYGVSNPDILANVFRTAIDGNTGELLRMWIE